MLTTYGPRPGFSSPNEAEEKQNKSSSQDQTSDPIALVHHFRKSIRWTRNFCRSVKEEEEATHRGTECHAEPGKVTPATRVLCDAGSTDETTGTSTERTCDTHERLCITTMATGQDFGWDGCKKTVFKRN